MASIKITGIEIFAHHGVLEFEQQNGQVFLIDCCFSLDTSHCSDQVENTVHYGELTQDIIAFTQNNRFGLIETLADELSSHLLIQYPLIDGIEITVHKPHAPIPATFQDVSITVTKAWKTCYLSIGSNLGDRKGYLDLVHDAISQDTHIKEMAQSSYIETAPHGVLDQPNFLNAVLKVSTFLTPSKLLNFCQQIERQAGRSKTRHWGERTLDVDILLYSNEIIRENDLTIPHPELHLRDFVLSPLCEIDPHIIHPVKHMSMLEIKQALDAKTAAKPKGYGL